MSENTITCPEHLNITMVQSFKESLQAAFDQGGEHLVDISAVQKVDTTGVQLLLVFQRALQQQGGKVRFGGESESFSNTVAMLGLTEHFTLS